jgi:uncharacterized protein YdbL (DUF1318 family)
MANINHAAVDQLAAEIAKGLAEYSQDVVEKVNVSSEKVGKAAVKQLKQTSPKRYRQIRKVLDHENRARSRPAAQANCSR